MKHKHESLVSIITPVYNGERYLTECIESVLAQTYTNWEYIILDNCSTDGTSRIAQLYAEKDNRIVVYHNDELVDVITNHNRAFQKISPESRYCKLLQADDWMFPDCIEAMVGLSDHNPDVGIVGAYSLAGTRVRNDGLLYSDTIVSGRTIARQTLLNQYYLFWSPSSLMIRSDLVRGRTPFYNPEYLHADVDTLFILLQACDFGFVHQVLTYIRVHEDSLTSVITKPMNRMILSNLHLYAMHGPSYLTQREFRDNLKKKMNAYYRFLASNALDLRETDFWQYHKEWLRKIGFRFERKRLVKAVMSHLINKPKQSIGKVVRAIGKKMNKVKFID
ncbi:MAG: glycosyltransferase family 2 protein [Pseudomonadota bacterium]